MRNIGFTALKNGLSCILRGRTNRKHASKALPNPPNLQNDQQAENAKVAAEDSMGQESEEIAVLRKSRIRGDGIATVQNGPLGKRPAACLQNCESCSGVRDDTVRAQDLIVATDAINSLQRNEGNFHRNPDLALITRDSILRLNQIMTPGSLGKSRNSTVAFNDASTPKEILTKIVLPEGSKLLSTITLTFKPTDQVSQDCEQTVEETSTGPELERSTPSRIEGMIDSIMSSAEPGREDQEDSDNEEETVVLSPRPSNAVWHGGGTGSCLGMMKKKAKRKRVPKPSEFSFDTNQQNTSGISAFPSTRAQAPHLGNNAAMKTPNNKRESTMRPRLEFFVEVEKHLGSVSFADAMDLYEALCENNKNERPKIDWTVNEDVARIRRHFRKRARSRHKSEDSETGSFQTMPSASKNVARQRVRTKKRRRIMTHQASKPDNRTPLFTPNKSADADEGPSNDFSIMNPFSSSNVFIASLASSAMECPGPDTSVFRMSNFLENSFQDKTGTEGHRIVSHRNNHERSHKVNGNSGEFNKPLDPAKSSERKITLRKRVQFADPISTVHVIDRPEAELGRCESFDEPTVRITSRDCCEAQHTCCSHCCDSISAPASSRTTTSMPSTNCCYVTPSCFINCVPWNATSPSSTSTADNCRSRCNSARCDSVTNGCGQTTGVSLCVLQASDSQCGNTRWQC